VTAPSKVYDGNTTAAPTLSVVAAGLVGTETVTATGTASFNSKDVLAANLVTVNSTVLANGLNGGLASNYSLAAGQTVAAHITPGSLGVAANAAAKNYDGLAYNGGNGVVYSGFVNGETSAVLGGALVYGGTSQNAINAGSYVIAPSGLTSGNYIISYTTGALGVTPASLGVAANSATRLYGAANPAFSATYSGFQNGETATVLTGTLALATPAVPTSNVGSYAITPSGQSSTNYNIVYVNGTLGVTPAPLGIAANAAAKTYDGLPYNGGNGVIYAGFRGADSAASLTGTLAYGGSSQGAVNVGNYAIIPSGQSSTNYTISYVNGNLGVIPAGLLGIAANAAAKTYDGLPNSGGNGVTYAGFRGADTAASLAGTLAYGGSSQGAINVGNYAIIPSGQSSPNYTIAYVNGTLGVIPAPLGISANSATRLYGGANPTFSATYRGFQNGETATVLTGTLALATPAVPTSNVGSYAITPSGQSSTNYTIAYVNGALGVTPAPLGVAANSATRLYGAANPAFSATYSGFQNGETATVLTGTLALATPAVPTSNVGSYAITPSGQSSTNYTIAYVNGALGVTPAPLGVAANSATRLYGAANPAFSATYSGFQNGETATVLSGALALATPAIPVSNVGSYSVTPSGQSSTNYTIAYVNGTLGVTPAPLGIAANAAAKTYDGLSYSGGNGVTYAGFRGTDTAASLTGALAYSGSSQGAVNVGNYAIIPSGQSSPNYTIAYVNGALSVTPAPLDIVANSATRLYGAANPAFSATYSGFQNGETTAVLSGTLALATPAVPSSNVGSYAITPSGQSSTNYTISYVNGTLGVTPAPLGITANSAVKTYDGLPYSGGNSVTYAGFRGTDTPASLAGTLAYSGSSQGAVSVGSYAITPFGLSSTNYIMTYVNGTLSVTPATTFHNPAAAILSTLATLLSSPNSLNVAGGFGGNGGFGNNAPQGNNYVNIDLMNVYGGNPVSLLFLHVNNGGIKLPLGD